MLCYRFDALKALPPIYKTVHFSFFTGLPERYAGCAQRTGFVRFSPI